MTLEWIAARLAIGTAGRVAALVQRQPGKSATSVNTLSLPPIIILEI